MKTKSQNPLSFGTWVDKDGHVRMGPPLGSKKETETKSKNLTKNEIDQVIDNYFVKLGNQIAGMMKESFPIKALVLKTADDQNLKFPDDIQESSQIEVGTGPVTVDDKPAEGKFTMPSGVTLLIEKGIVKEITQPTAEQIAARIRQDMVAFRSQLKAFVNESSRKPNEAQAKVTAPGANRVPFKKRSI